MNPKALWSIVIVTGLVVAGTMAFRGGTVPPLTGMLADVGVVVGVAPNPYNTLNEQLDQRQLAIDQQQADLAAREAAFASSTQAASPAYAWYLGIAVVVLALLVILNFYLDWRREKAERGSSQ